MPRGTRSNSRNSVDKSDGLPKKPVAPKVPPKPVAAPRPDWEIVSVAFDPPVLQGDRLRKMVAVKDVDSIAIGTTYVTIEMPHRRYEIPVHRIVEVRYDKCQ